MKTTLILILAAFVCGSALAESRVWTSTNGKTVEAELVERSATNVKLKRSLDDVILDVPIASLSEADQKFIGEEKPSATGLREVLADFTEKAKARKIEKTVVNRAKTGEILVSLTRYEIIENMGNPNAKQHFGAWSASKGAGVITKSLAELRAAVAALPQTAETRTFLTRDLDPAVAAIAAFKANDAEITHGQIAALARLHTALNPIK